MHYPCFLFVALLLWPLSALGALGDRTLVDSFTVPGPMAEVVMDLPAGCIKHEIDVIGLQGTVYDNGVLMHLRSASTGQWRATNENAQATHYLGSDGEVIKEKHQGRHALFIYSRGLESETSEPTATLNSRIHVYHASRSGLWTNLSWLTTYQTVIAIHGSAPGGGSVKIAEAHDAIRFAPGQGNIVAGTFLVYCVSSE